jgi:hypothetical protein
MIQNIITYTGGNGPNCSKIFELSTVVMELLNKYINVDRFNKLREPLTKLSNDNQNKFERLYEEIEGIYTGNIYNKKNKDITAFVNNPKQQSQSFRTFLIKFAMEDYKRKFDSATNKTTFYTTFGNYFKSKFPTVGLETKQLKELKEKNKHVKYINKTPFVYNLKNYSIDAWLESMRRKKDMDLLPSNLIDKLINYDMDGVKSHIIENIKRLKNVKNNICDKYNTFS